MGRIDATADNQVIQVIQTPMRLAVQRDGSRHRRLQRPLHAEPSVQLELVRQIDLLPDADLTGIRRSAEAVRPTRLGIKAPIDAEPQRQRDVAVPILRAEGDPVSEQGLEVDVRMELPGVVARTEYEFVRLSRSNRSGDQHDEQRESKNTLPHA